MRRVRFSSISFALIFTRTILFVGAIMLSTSARSSSYFEAGTLLGKMANSGTYFNTPGLTTPGTGFLGTFSWYQPVTLEKRFVHLELGFQTRLYTPSSVTPSHSLAIASPNLATRIEFWRLYAGAGYAPINFASMNGVTMLRHYTDHSSYFMEGGLIWRVVPELQITLNYSMETAVDRTGSKATSTGYGLTFRFPLNPKDAASKNAVDFDGGRYPFGFMKD